MIYVLALVSAAVTVTGAVLIMKATPRIPISLERRPSPLITGSSQGFFLREFFFFSSHQCGLLSDVLKDFLEQCIVYCTIKNIFFLILSYTATFHDLVLFMHILHYHTQLKI